MNHLFIIYLIMNFSFWCYIIYILIKYGILPSVSDSYYVLPKKPTYIPFKIKKINGTWEVQMFKYVPSKDLFRIFTICFSIPALIVGLSLSIGSNYQFLMFLASAGIAFVGASPEFKSHKLEQFVHVGAALTGVICNTAFLLIVFAQYWYIPSVFILITIPFLMSKMKNKTYWIELLSFTTFSITIGLILFN